MSEAPSSPQALQQELRKLIASDQLEVAIEGLLAGNPEADYRNRVIQQSAQLEHWKRLRQQGTEDFADLARTRNRVSMNLLDLVDTLPAALPEATPTPAARKGTTEARLKSRLIWMLLIGKFTVLVFTYALQESGGLTVEQFLAILSILVPVFATNIALLTQDITANRSLLAANERPVRRDFARLAYGVVLAYPVILLFVINLKGPGILSFQQLTVLLALAESSMGVYISKVVLGLVRGRG